MFQFLYLIYLLINIVYTENNQCSSLHNKLNQYGLHIDNQEKNFPGLKLCQGLINDYCCPQIYENKIQNLTAIELYHVFELNSINLYELLLRLNIELNNTIIKLIESSRNKTHFIFQYNYKIFSNSYHSLIDIFFNNLLIIIHKNSYHDIKNNIEEFFQNILRMSIELNNNNNKLILPTYISCVWKNHPFGNIPNIIRNQLEINFGKLFYLKQLFKLSIEFVQIMSMSVTTDNHCIDSYMQLSYCNLCSGRKELPCLSNCINVIESCLVNVSLINDVWIKFIDSMENVAYFNSIEKVLSSIGIFISDSLMTFFNSDGIKNKDIINQCGDVRIRKDIFNNDQKFSNEYNNSLVLLFDKQLISIRKSLEIYKSFWLMLPKNVCKSIGLSISNDTPCWTGTSISRDKKQFTRINYDKPLNLRLQWILKEMKDKSQIIGNLQKTAKTINNATKTNSLLINELKLNLTDNLDDYLNDNQFDYSDYAYEDSIDELPLSTSTILPSSSTSTYDDIFIDDINTVSYYDYGEQDVYSDDEIDETSTQRLYSFSTIITTTTTINQIPSYHQRKPIIWNININNDDDGDFDQQLKQQYNSSLSLSYSFLLLLLLLLMFILI